MSDINKEIRSQALNAEARRADREKHFDLVFKAHQNKTENFVDEQLVIDPDWVHSSKVLFEWNEGRPFEGDDRSAAEYGYNELARFNNKYFNSSEPWSETDSRELLDHMMRLKNAGDHQKVAFSYLHEVFDQKDPAVSGFHNISKQVAASPSDILTSASLVDRYSGRQSAKNSAKYVSRRLARDVMATRMGEFLPQDEMLFDESDAALLDDIETLYPTGGERQLSGNWREDLGFLGSAASVALGLAKGIYEGVPAGIQGILDLGADLDSKMPLGKVVWGRGNGIEWVSPDDPNYQNAPSITIAGADAFAADEVDPNIPNGEIIAKELAKGLTQFITVFTLGGGLAGKMARGLAAGALADATFDPQAGNLSTVLKEFGVENELVNFLDSQVGEDATSEERLVARTKQAFEGLGLSALIEPFIIAVKRAKDMGAGPAVKSMLQDAGDAWMSLVPAPGQLNMGIGTTGGATGKRVGTTGQYVGAPAGITTPQSLAGLTRRVTELVKEGEAGRYWYERSGESIMRAVNNDPVEAEKIAQLIGIFSSNTPVENNMQFALQAYFQHKAGMPIRSGMFPTAMSKKAEAVLNGTPWEGRKTNNFYNNLMRVIDPSRDQGVTVDVWMMRAFGYDKDSPTEAQYDFVEKKVNEITARFNENLAPGDQPWEPQQTQAAIWVAAKAKEPVKGKPEGIGIEAAKFDYADAMDAMRLQVSWESIPGRTATHLPEMFDAPYAQQVEYHVAISKAFLDDDGADIVAKRLGILSPGDFEAPGYFEGKVSPGSQTEVIAPRQYKGPTYGKIDASIEDLINRYAAVRGVLMKQDGVAWHRPFWKSTKKDQDGAEINIGRPFTEEEVAELAQRVAEKVGHTEFNPISTRGGVRLINFEYMQPGQNPDGLGNLDFQKVVMEVMTEVEWDVEFVIDRFATQSNYLANNWSEAPNGEGYIQNSSKGQSDILGQLRNIISELQPRIDDVDRDFAERYGWTINDAINTDFGSVE